MPTTSTASPRRPNQAKKPPNNAAEQRAMHHWLRRDRRGRATDDPRARSPSSPRRPARRECRRTDRGGPWSRSRPRCRACRWSCAASGSSWSASPRSARRCPARSKCRRECRRHGCERNTGLPSRMRISSAFSSPRQRGGGEAGADLDALHRVDAHHRAGEIGVELAVDRLAQSGRHAAGDDFDHRAGRRAALAHVVEIAFPVLRRLAVGRPERIVVDRVPVPARAVDLVRARSGSARRE